MIVADPGRFTLATGTSTFVGRRQIWIAAQLGGGTVREVQMPEWRLGVEVHVGHGVLQQRTRRSKWCGSRQTATDGGSGQ